MQFVLFDTVEKYQIKAILIVYGYRYPQSTLSDKQYKHECPSGGDPMSVYEHLLRPAGLEQLEQRSRRTAWRPIQAILARIRDVFSRIFVCWHRKMSRPFTRDGETYRVCLRCGKHRQFDVGEWKTKGVYYNDSPASQATATSFRRAKRSEKLRLIA